MAHRDWTDNENAFVRAQAGTLTYAQIAGHIGRTRAAVAQRAFKLGVVVKRPWTKAERYQLFLLAGTKTTIEVAKELNRSVQAVEQQAMVLGVKFTKGRFFSATDAAHGLGVQRDTVGRWVERLGLLEDKTRTAGRMIPLDEEDVVELCNALLDGRISPSAQWATTTARVRAYRDWLLGITEKAEPGFRPNRGQRKR